MNENINLCNLLKGHEGKTFYSPIFGNLLFVCIIYPCVRFKTISGDIWDINFNGKFYNNSDELCVYPSNEQRDWNKWIEEQNIKTPKTWSELCKIDNRQVVREDCIGIDTFQIITYNSPEVVKSAIALLKIHKLIEVGYDGNIANRKWNGRNKFAVIRYNTETKSIEVCHTITTKHHICFKTTELANEFLSHSENIQLIKDYYMI